MTGLHERLAPLLLDWWKVHGRRDLPWQKDPSPYRVWVSEIMLQQTQVPTVARYYDRFMAAFPNVTALADAPLDQVLHQWSGLGYYARARNLHCAAQIVRDEYRGELPSQFDVLMSLPGIGRSTAGAILSLAFAQRWPILDGNVKRVLARLFNVSGWPGSTKVAKQLWAHAEQCTPDRQVAWYTQAIMDFGATVCARSPDCGHCPLQMHCEAFRADTVAEVPAPRPRRNRPRRTTVMVLVVRDDDHAVLLERRPAEGIWGGLWSFPELPDRAGLVDWCLQKLGSVPCSEQVCDTVSHSFTHFDLDIQPIRVSLPLPVLRVMEPERWLWYKLRQPAEVGLAAPVDRLIETIGES
ncbi:MAG TPA: A/G-specific adenine glycosylase [Chromatiales bacterium]|nr:A/G-specific adenine glycosylase [Chromatiales bacterium]